MPRNSSGTYTLPEPAFTPNTPIVSAAVNSDFDDVASALTDSLSRSGDGGMQAALPLNIAGFFYQGDTDTGMSRPSANTQVITCGGVDVVEVTSTGVEVLGTPLVPIPVGIIWPYGGTSAPSGFLLCYGQAVSRTTYASLFAVIGTAYGAGDSATTFNVPDLRGRIPAGKDNMGGSAASRLTGTTMTPDGNTLGAVSGNNQTVTLAANQIPSLTSVNASQAITVASASIAYDTSTLTTNTAPGSVGQILTNSRTIGPLSSSGNNSISVTYTNGSQQAVPNVQPTIIANYIIYAGA